jgi:hypothetical protein
MPFVFQIFKDDEKFLKPYGKESISTKLTNN